MKDTVYIIMISVPRYEETENIDPFFTNESDAKIFLHLVKELLKSKVASKDALLFADLFEASLTIEEVYYYPNMGVIVHNMEEALQYLWHHFDITNYYLAGLIDLVDLDDLYSDDDNLNSSEPPNLP